MTAEELQKQLETKKSKLSISRAQVAVEELEMKIAERELDIQRMKDHIALQLEVINNAEKELQNK